MPSAIVVGGGLAGMGAAVALAEAGLQVDLFEARARLGGRASSFPPPDALDPGELIDNCQHILLGCCTNLLDFYARLGVRGLIRFHDAYHFVERGGRTSRLRASRLPAPWHLLGSFLRLPFLERPEKLAILRGLAALRRQSRRTDLDRVTMGEWLAEQRQPLRAVWRFWHPVLASAVNEELNRMAAAHGFQVFRLAFLGDRGAFRMGVPSAPLSLLYGSRLWPRIARVQVHLQSPVERLMVVSGAGTGVVIGGQLRRADQVILAVPPDRIPALAPELELDVSPFEYVPITGIHLWFDRPVTDLPQAALIEGPIHWVFNKSGGRYLLGVASASRSLVDMSREHVVELALREIKDHFPAAVRARLERAHVVKELRATFSAKPGLEAHRPPAETRVRNVFLAGDWARTGWPATMEGAVRSGYLAAEAVTRAAGSPQRFLIPDSGSKD